MNALMFVSRRTVNSMKSSKVAPGLSGGGDGGGGDGGGGEGGGGDGGGGEGASTATATSGETARLVTGT